MKLARDGGAWRFTVPKSCKRSAGNLFAQIFPDPGAEGHWPIHGSGFLRPCSHAVKTGRIVDCGWRGYSLRANPWPGASVKMAAPRGLEPRFNADAGIFVGWKVSSIAASPGLVLGYGWRLSIAGGNNVKPAGGQKRTLRALSAIRGA